jgi:hypothetical protein
MTPETKSTTHTATWIAGAFGLAIVLGSAFITGFLNWPFSGRPEEKKPKTQVTATEDNRPKAVSYPSSDGGSTYDSEKGEVALAKLWASIDAEQLAQITAGWKPVELAPVLMRMRTEQVAELLAAMPAERASAVSREIKRLSSL